ncbi:hypothetical protein BDY21DRAFT_162049 [Lineolata rhizophorae]|uniref:Uncharacterized protein n=1 Tax=Lineolata rhizophorae TaxID=578093 RepID=A0A6A6P8Y3_9PEZI|nr:hypothetical protein BDY21DRAFT_162049 [Lineolata rhizophorae]
MTGYSGLLMASWFLSLYLGVGFSLPFFFNNAFCANGSVLAMVEGCSLVISFLPIFPVLNSAYLLFSWVLCRGLKRVSASVNV